MTRPDLDYVGQLERNRNRPILLPLIVAVAGISVVVYSAVTTIGKWQYDKGYTDGYDQGKANVYFKVMDQTQSVIFTGNRGTVEPNGDITICFWGNGNGILDEEDNCVVFKAGTYTLKGVPKKDE